MIVKESECMKDNKFVSVTEASKLLSVHPQTVRRMLYDGRLSGFQLNISGFYSGTSKEVR